MIIIIKIETFSPREGGGKETRDATFQNAFPILRHASPLHQTGQIPSKDRGPQSDGRGGSPQQLGFWEKG